MDRQAYLSVREVMGLSELSKRVVLAAVRRGELKSRRSGKRIFIPRDEVGPWLERRGRPRARVDSNPDPQRYVSVREACRLTGLSKDVLLGGVRRREFAVLTISDKRFAKRHWIDRQELLAWQQRVFASAPPGATLTLREVSRETGLSVRVLLLATGSGDLQAAKVRGTRGPELRIAREDLDAWLALRP
ncbi:MAG: helix-turn-helix domain-containing protein, partial [Candidatus Eremiobacterota bacterium]